MDNSQHRSASRAGRLLAEALFELAEQRADVRAALEELRDWIDERLGERPAEHGVQAERRGAADDTRCSVDLTLVIDRSSWKADACRFAVELREAKRAGSADALASKRDELLERRDQLQDCYAWMIDANRMLPSDECMQQIAACYDNIALAAQITDRLERAGLLSPAPPSELLYALAEAQSALLVGLQEVDLRGDSDQRDLFLWLKDQTTQHRVYVDRHMRLDDPADFRAAASLAERLRKLANALIERSENAHARQELLTQIRDAVEDVVASGSDSGARSVAELVERWSQAGFYGGDAGLRAALEPLVGVIDLERVPASLAAIMDHEDQDTLVPHRRSANNGAEPDDKPRPEYIARAAQLLSGRRVVMFGRAERPVSKAALERELKLGELVWIELDPAAAESVLEHEIQAVDVDLVLIAMRLPAPAYATFRRLCQEHEKPFVRLPNGYGPGQVAHQVLRQVGRRLSPAEPQESR